MKHYLTQVKLEKTNRNKFLATIKSENDRLGKLVENVLQSSLHKRKPRIEVGTNIEDVINKVIKSITLSFNKRWNYKKLTFGSK